VAVTRFGLEGYGVRRAGTFSAKTGATHPVGIITRLALDGYGARRAGTFSGKTPESTGPVVGITGGGRISGGYFSRKRWHELIGELRGEARAEKRVRKKKALVNTAAALNEALDAIDLQIQTAETNRQLHAMEAAIQAAIGAHSVADTIRLTKAAIAHVENIKLVQQLEDDDEAIAILLMN